MAFCGSLPEFREKFPKLALGQHFFWRIPGHFGDLPTTRKHGLRNEKWLIFGVQQSKFGWGSQSQSYSGSLLVFVVPVTYDLLRAFLRLPRFESTHFLASGFLTLCRSHLDKLGNQVGLIIPYINLGYNMVIPIARLKKIVARPLAARVKERSLHWRGRPARMSGSTSCRPKKAMQDSWCLGGSQWSFSWEHGSRFFGEYDLFWWFRCFRVQVCDNLFAGLWMIFLDN